MIADQRGKRVHPMDRHDSIRLREYFAAHCPMTVTEAWAMFSRLSTGGDYPITEAKTSHFPEFMKFYAQRRFEYADAMMKENREAVEGE